jgi:hypothetical protein
MFRSIFLSKSVPMFVCRSALGMFLTATATAHEPVAAASAGPIQTVQYYPGVPYGVPQGITPQQLLALGARQRAIAAGIASHAAGRMDATLNQAQHFDMEVIRGCGFYRGQYYCQ